MKLRDIVAEFLADLTRAQHRTNELSKRLACKYRNDRLLRFFPVPNALLDEATVTLRFAAHEAAAAGDAEPNPDSDCPPELHPSFGLRLAYAVVAPALASLSARLRQSAPEDDVRTRLADALAGEPAAQAVARRMRRLLDAFAARAAHVGPEDALVDTTLRRLGPALRDALYEDEDLRAHVADLDAYVGQALDDPAGATRETLVHAAAAAQALASTASHVPEMDVIVDGPSLAHFPDHAIHSMTLKARLRNYKWIIVERDGALIEEDLLPEQ